MSMEQIGEDHIFNDGMVYGWPGLSDAKHLLEAWNLLARLENGEIDDREFLQRLYENTGEELGWAMSMAEFVAPLVGVHLHILDAAGHAYATQEDSLRRVYEDVDTMVGSVRSAVDALVVCSDHGMTVEWLDDEPGEHSWRAMFATTEEGDLPGSVFDIREWLERHAGPDRRPAATGTGTAISRAQLEALGYVDS
jgi:phosphoserine phosphatase